MKKLLFILSVFLAAAACDDSISTDFIKTTPTIFEVEANTGGTYAFTTDVPAYVDSAYCAHYAYYPATRGSNNWERPKTLPTTHELGWFSVTQLTDTTFEVTIGKEHDSNSILEISVRSYVPGVSKSEGRILFYLR